MRTYREIQREYKNRFNSTIKTCWIADVKRELGMTSRIAYNRISKNNVQYPCPSNEIKRRIQELLK